MRRNIEKLSGELQLTNLKTCQTKPEVEVPSIQDPNRQFPAFSRCVSLKYSAERGRFGVAARDIRLGELLCEETPADILVTRALRLASSQHNTPPPNTVKHSTDLEGILYF